MRQFWNKNQENFLREQYEINGLSYLQIVPLFLDIFGFERTENSLKIKGTRLKLRHSIEQTFNIKSDNMSGSKNPMFEKEAWSKGLTKNENSSLKNTSEKLRKIMLYKFANNLINTKGSKNGMFGKIPWSYGLNKENHKSLKLLSEKLSEYHSERLSHISQDEKDFLGKRMTRATLKKRSETGIELKVRKILRKLKIKFIQNYELGNYFPDFFLPDYNLLIECHGDYWHCNPSIYKNRKITQTQIDNKNRDLIKSRYYHSLNIPELILWELDINRDMDSIERKIKRFIFENCLIQGIIPPFKLNDEQLRIILKYKNPMFIFKLSEEIQRDYIFTDKLWLKP